ncbi:hypothetical protein D3Z36_13455 [Lachnospiraceae bacterium]|nr:hypothetical protein [Lachnospiraceae bacterium]
MNFFPRAMRKVSRLYLDLTNAVRGKYADTLRRCKFHMSSLMVGNCAGKTARFYTLRLLHEGKQSFLCPFFHAAAFCASHYISVLF